MSMESAAKETEILNLLAGFSGSPITDANVDAYLDAVEDYSAEAVALACRRYLAGDVPGQNKAFRPSAAELVEQVRLFVSAIKYQARADGLIAYRMGEAPPDGTVALGPVEVDFGSGRIDMRNMSPAEKAKVFEHRGRPPVEIEGARFTPKLRGME